jgi:hypothetical protein
MGLNSRYEIRVKGILDGRWTAWFEGLHIASDGEETVICGGDHASGYHAATRSRPYQGDSRKSRAGTPSPQGALGPAPGTVHPTCCYSQHSPFPGSSSPGYSVSAPECSGR